MRLYHHPMSFNARRAVLSARQLGVDVELVLVDLSKGEQRKESFLKLNPNGKVPVLDDGGFVLWESHAIMQYLADKTPGQTVYPTELRARADVNRWLFWSAHHWAPSVSILNWERCIKGMIGQGAADPVHVKRGEEQVLALSRLLDAHLADREWIHGDRVTLADLAIAPPLTVKDAAQLPVGDFPRLLRWFDRVQSLPAWKA